MKQKEETEKQNKETDWGMLKDLKLPMKWRVATFLAAALVTVLSYVFYTGPMMRHLTDPTSYLTRLTFDAFPTAVQVTAWSFFVFLLFALPPLVGIAAWWLGVTALGRLGVTTTSGHSVSTLFCVSSAKTPDYLPFLTEEVNIIVLLCGVSSLTSGTMGFIGLVFLSESLVAVSSFVFCPMFVAWLVLSIPGAAKKAHRELTERGTDDLPRHDLFSNKWWYHQKPELLPMRWRITEGAVVGSSIPLFLAVVLVFFLPAGSGSFGMPVWLFATLLPASLAVPFGSYWLLWRREQARLEAEGFNVDAHKIIQKAKSIVSPLAGWLDRVPHGRLIVGVACVAVASVAVWSVWPPLDLSVSCAVGFPSFLGAFGLLMVLACVSGDDRAQAARDRAVAEGYVTVDPLVVV